MTETNAVQFIQSALKILLANAIQTFQCVTLKTPITTAADDIHNFCHCFSEKMRLDVSSEVSARQRIDMKNQALFSSKDKSKKLKCCLLQFLFGAIRVKVWFICSPWYPKFCLKTDSAECFMFNLISLMHFLMVNLNALYALIFFSIRPKN